MNFRTTGFRTLSTATALTALAATPALAGNLEPTPLEPAPVFTSPAPTAPIYDFSGFYVGLQANYIDTDADLDGDGDDDADGDGGMAGFRLGYDYVFANNLLLGGVLQYDVGSIDIDPDIGPTAAEIEDVLRIGARVGLTSNRNMYYATAGYALADTDNVGDSDGYFAGLGYEVFLTPRLTLGAEALYHEFDDFDGPAEADATTVGLNLNYRF